jgi:hypothetical protein
MGLHSREFIKKTDRRVKFGTKDKQAIEAARMLLRATLPVAT